MERPDRLARDQRGFTLVEILVVILIIAILAAVAIPTFIGQRIKSQDVSAKSNARNAQMALEICFRETDTYANCDLSGAGVSTAAGDPEQVGVTGPNLTGSPGSTGYLVYARSRSGNYFAVNKENATTTRRCVSYGSPQGGCRTSDEW